MKKLHLFSGLLFLSSLFVSCAPAVNPAETFPIAPSQAWKMLANGTAKGQTFTDDFRIGTDFELKNGFYLVSVQSNKFGGVAVFDPKNNVFNVTLFTETVVSVSSSKVMSCFLLYDGKRLPSYIGAAFFGTIGDITNQLDNPQNAGRCIASQADSKLSGAKRISDHELVTLQPALEKLEHVALEYAAQKQ
jgi:hypothetical protein